MRSFADTLDAIGRGARPLTISLSPDMEKRLLEAVQRYNDEHPDDLMPLGTQEQRDYALDVQIFACVERGLDDSDRDLEREWVITAGTWRHYSRSRQRRDAARWACKRALRRVRSLLFTKAAR